MHKEIRTFGTMTRDLLGLSDWLLAEGVTHLAMESTGVFWKPIYNILEGQFEIVLVNARHVKNVPGRKTDVKDCEWLAQLLQCGLLRGSFIPALPQRELRDLTRMRKQLTHEMSAVANRIHKVLEDANIKLGLVATDILGVSGRRMLAALIDGETDVDKMADLACRRLRDKIPLLRLALHGKVTEHHRFMLKRLMDHLCYLEREIEQFSKQIEVASRPFNKAITALIPIPGIDLASAQNVIAEIGPNMKQYPTDAHLASWAKICPGNNESAGKRKSGTTGSGNRWLNSTLVQISWAAVHTKDSYFQAQFRRLAGRRGKKRALSSEKRPPIQRTGGRLFRSPATPQDSQVPCQTARSARLQSRSCRSGGLTKERSRRFVLFSRQRRGERGGSVPGSARFQRALSV